MNSEKSNGTLLPHGPKASELAVEHHQDGHPEPVVSELAATCPLCYASADTNADGDRDE